MSAWTPDEHPEIEGRYRFTLGHEGGGHWRLHRAYLVTDPAQTSMFDGLSRPAVICRSSQAKERVEWQADFYASCLLMPRKMVTEAWRRITRLFYELMKHMPAAHRPRGYGLRSVGRVLPNVLEPEHTYLFDQVAKRFAPNFGVSAQAMRIRLEKLGLLHREVPRQGSLAVGS